MLVLIWLYFQIQPSSMFQSTAQVFQPNEKIVLVNNQGDMMWENPSLIFMPVGSIVPWPASIPPDGWVLCKSTTDISHPKFNTLKNVIGGAGNFPIFDNRVPVGLKNSTLGAKGGSKRIVITEANMPKHRHEIFYSSDEFNESADTHAFKTLPEGTTTQLFNADTDRDGVYQGSVRFDPVTITLPTSTENANPSSSTPYSVMQKTLGLNYIIKY